MDIHIDLVIDVYVNDARIVRTGLERKDCRIDLILDLVGLDDRARHHMKNGMTLAYVGQGEGQGSRQRTGQSWNGETDDDVIEKRREEI